ncbi:twin-arginine translocase TatA/TatE family subunit [uncultured Corynebacterium sp.]|uniref:Sec-independent protein translocase subunit TatA/TatB n=1 Tax=uncultured Corynebacterium sp. TaxID=159447 RepID=UPI0025EA6E69|nr:twin-arginine translocase TatA/TatE family subunit [uncultured Corynebacterium sp.]
MLGLSLEKLIVIGIIAAMVIGPERLPQYAAKLGEFVRGLREFIASSKAAAESDLGVPIDTAGWNRQVRRYDPRTIVRDAWTGNDTPATTPDFEPATATAAEPAADDAAESAEAPTMRERWVVVGGTSGHPVRRRILEPVPAEQPTVGEPRVQDGTVGAPTTGVPTGPAVTESAAPHGIRQ